MTRTKDPVCAVLAAGGSRRLGRPKQLVSIDGQPLVRRVASRAASRFTTAVIVGAHASEVMNALTGAPITLIENPSWEGGLSSSVKHAVLWARTMGAPALIVLLGDQPLLDAAHLEALTAAWRAGADVVASFYAERAGVPALFDASILHELETLEGDAGAARILRGRAGVATIQWPAGEVDIDTEEDVRAHSAR